MRALLLVVHCKAVAMPDRTRRGIFTVAMHAKLTMICSLASNSQVFDRLHSTSRILNVYTHQDFVRTCGAYK